MAKSRRSDNMLNQVAAQNVCSYLSMARAIAEPIADAGDTLGSYEVWACTLRLLTETTEGGGVMKAEFRRVLKSCESDSMKPEAKLAAVRTAARPYVGGEADARNGPPHRTALSDIRWFIDVAIQIGAPSYNTGDHRGCYEVYAATARFVSKAVKGADDAKERLTEALQQCLDLDDPNNQAWAMRHGFDDVLSGSFGPPITDASAAVCEYIRSAISDRRAGLRLGRSPRVLRRLHLHCTAHFEDGSRLQERKARTSGSARRVYCSEQRVGAGVDDALRVRPHPRRRERRVNRAGA